MSLIAQSAEMQIEPRFLFYLRLAKTLHQEVQNRFLAFPANVVTENPVRNLPDHFCAARIGTTTNFAQAIRQDSKLGREDRSACRPFQSDTR